jgi:hypothetical protein
LAVPELTRLTADTHIDELQRTLVPLAAVVIGLAIVNQGTAEMRGENRRVTGLMPFWIVAFGSVGLTLTAAGAGLVQVYLQRVMMLPTAEVRAYLSPLYAAWGIMVLTVLPGLVIYFLGLWWRRPDAMRRSA